MIEGLFSYFTDPITRAPLIGAMLICTSSALVGVLVFLKRTSLLGEALSHAAYPGVIVGLLTASFFIGSGDLFQEIVMLFGASATACFGYWLIRLLQTSFRVSPDSSLTFTLSYLFGIGILLASHIQFSHAALFRRAQIYFFGQAATITDQFLPLFFALFLFVVTVIALFQKEFKAWIFNPEFAKTIGIRVRLIEVVALVLVTLSIVIGIRAIGVVLMSAMLIAPSAAARQWTSRFDRMFLIAGIIGALSALFGTILASEGAAFIASEYNLGRFSLPTGPVIVILASFFCLFSLAFSKERGFLRRFFKVLFFRAACVRENLLKSLWKYGPESFSSLKEKLFIPAWVLHVVLFKLKREGYVECKDGVYLLTQDGFQRASHIVRLHRLWEVYLADYIGLGKSRVHASAEEMEHILTKDLENELVHLLKDPKHDPHRQPIPPTPWSG